MVARNAKTARTAVRDRLCSAWQEALLQALSRQRQELLRDTARVSKNSLLRVSSAIHLNGVRWMPLASLKKTRRGPSDRDIEWIFARQGRVPEQLPEVTLGNDGWVSAMEPLRTRVMLVEEVNKFDEFDVGTIVEVTPTELTLLTIDVLGAFDDEPTTLPLSSVLSVSADTEYLRVDQRFLASTPPSNPEELPRRTGAIDLDSRATTLTRCARPW